MNAMEHLRTSDQSLSISHGIALMEETGCGALTLGDYLREIVDRHGPAEAAVIHVDGQAIRWTYDDLWQRSRQVARALKACGAGKGTRVGLLMTNRLEFLSCLFGTALVGGVATMISTFFTAPEIDTTLQMSGCSILLFERKVLNKDFARILVELEPEISNSQPGKLGSLRFPHLRQLAQVDCEEGQGAIEGWSAFLVHAQYIWDEQIDACAASVSSADPAALFFSSGSTGKAKGILTAHRGICLQMWRWRNWQAIVEPPRTWSANGFFFSGNFTMALGGTLSSGGCLVLQRTFDPIDALYLIQQERASLLLAWPHQWPQLEAVPGYADADLSALQYLDQTTPLARHSSVNTDWSDPCAYGNTECFTLISAFPAMSPLEATGGSHGRPTPGSTIKIVDPGSGATVPLGVRGEIAIKGPTLMLGYIGVPLDETLDSEGFLRTGDGGYLDGEGRLFWEGRLNDIIKTGGANVSPLEIDAVLRDCPGIKMVQTVGIPDPLLGEIVVSCIVPLVKDAVAPEDVQSFARKKLASFKVPRHVLFFAEHELALTGSAKIKTADLRRLAVSKLEAELPA